jgi:hypothetical protein
MKYLVRWGWLILLITALIGCGHVFHNGTEMAVSSVEVSGLPVSLYKDVTMVFSYDTGGGWIHDIPTEFNSGNYSAKVDANGNWKVTFSSPLIVKTASLTFLLIDKDKNWNTYKVDKKHSGKSGGDVMLDNTWAGAANPVQIKGVVNGDDVEWTLE